MFSFTQLTYLTKHMKRIFNTLAVAMIGSVVFYSCATEDVSTNNEISPEVLALISNAGFSTDIIFPMKSGEGYLVEGDIYLTENDLRGMADGSRIPSVEQYRTTNLVNAGGGRVITVYAPVGGRSGYSAGMIAGLDLAISRYNQQNLTISFQRVTSSTGADIVMSRLSKGDERRGVLGSAGFPTASGDPYGQILMSGVLESSYGLSTAGIATIIAHEMGHCIGFRHTDYFNRAVSCGGAASNEGDGGVGAIHIPGTPTGATAADKSWMLACTDGGDRPFNADDRTALDYLY
jgi:hypothetical protein